MHAPARERPACLVSVGFAAAVDQSPLSSSYRFPVLVSDCRRSGLRPSDADGNGACHDGEMAVASSNGREDDDVPLDATRSRSHVFMQSGLDGMPGFDTSCQSDYAVGGFGCESCRTTAGRHAGGRGGSEDSALICLETSLMLDGARLGDRDGQHGEAG